jgi:peptidoglycan/LPS O-acetylase OafA/YrhL
MKSAHVQYRPDIDGLRAVAVVGVLIFHVAQSFLRGGYVGVDVFFVISGYLISSNILAQAEQGKFSVARFYEHRLRRIFPAYAVVLVFTTIVVMWKFVPSEIGAYSKALAAAIASVTNFYFWATSDYFAVSAEELPLLHTWSLAVEEQFYLLFPALVVGIYRWVPKRRDVLIVAIFLVSLALSIWGVYAAPIATFYLLPTRAWELLLGTLLAIKIVPVPRTDLQRNLVAGAGLVLIALPMVLYWPYTRFPGLAAVPPCLGAALIMLAGETGDSLVGRLLSLRPVVFVGLISYSLYLWHWPIMVFQRTDFLLVSTDSRLVTRGAVMIASFVCATLSWWIVERTTRNRRLVPTRTLVAGSGVAALALLLSAGALSYTGGFQQRFTPDALAVAKYLDYDEKDQFREGTCFLDRDTPFTKFDRTACLPDVPNRPNYLLIGDSHAAALSDGLRHAFPDANILQLSGVGCPPTIALQPAASEACTGLNHLAFDELPRTRKISKAWLVARWNVGRLGQGPGWNKDWLTDLLRTVEELKQRGIEPVVVGPMPEYQSRLPRLLAKSIEARDPGLVARALTSDSLALDRQMADFAREHGIAYVSLAAVLCPDGACMTHAGPGVPLLFDSDHLTAAGSALVAAKIAAQLR